MFVLIEIMSLLLAGTFVQADHRVEVKDVNAPAADIVSGRVRMPDPSTCGMSSVTALLPHDLAPGFKPGAGKALVALLADDIEAWTLELVPTANRDTTPVSGQLQHAGPLLPGKNALVALPELGAEHHRIHVVPPDEQAEGWLLVADGHDNVRLRSHFGSHDFLVGAPLVIHSNVEGGALIDGVVHARSPSGQRVETVMAAVGKQGATAAIQIDEPGDWTFRTEVRVRDDTGGLRIRTTQQLVTVEHRVVDLAGMVSVMPLEGGRIGLTIPVTVLPSGESAEPRRVAVGCEIWGMRTGDSRLVPVCWAARMQQLTGEGGEQDLILRFDERWLGIAGVDPDSISLRELRVQSASSFVPFVHEASPGFAIEGVLSPTLPIPDKALPEMLAGHSGQSVTGYPAGSMMSPGGHVALLSHGYCEIIFPWPTDEFSGDFELFLDLEQNRTHDEFALLYEAHGRNFKSMGITGHSQAGNAAAHLYTFYWSSLDWATGPRKIQAVGVPWLGTPLATNVAVLGEIFGIGCGPHFDMTYDGSALWVSWIPTWVREETWYWTTSFEDFPFWYDYCQLISDVLLTDPDDGVIEQWAGQLSGANNGGHKEAWCHTRFMRDPPQCNDSARNAEIDAEGAR